MIERIAEMLQSPASYLPDLVSFICTFIEGLVCMLLLTFGYRRRKLYALRLLGCIAVGILLAGLFTLWKAPFGDRTDALAIFSRTATYTLLILYLLGVLAFCYREPLTECALCWSTSVSVNSVAAVSYSLLLNLCGIDDRATISFWPQADIVRDYALLIAYHLLIYILFAVLFARRNRLSGDRRTSVNVAVLSVGIVFSMYVLGSYSRAFEYMSLELTISTKLFKVICSAFVILLAFGLLQRDKLAQDLEITEQLLLQEKRQYETSKETVETINMKCHDLKHRLESFEHKLNEEELRSLKDAIDIYDSNIKTGNQILDVVLYEKQLLCRRSGIRLSCMANGALLSFMTPSHLYSLFGNAIDNAIEAVKAVDDEGKRLIDISLSAAERRAVIEISNYFAGELRIEKGIPSTTKQDGNRHGYGMKSMQYIAEQYGGTLETSAQGDIFTLKISIPLPAQK